MEADKRELGKIVSVHEDDEDRGIETVWIYLEFHGGGQGFGGLMLRDETHKKTFVSQLCKTFGVRKLMDLVGKDCYALRCWGFLNDVIEGLESVTTGKRFTISGWRRSQGLTEFGSPLDERRKRLSSDLEHTKRRLKDLEVEIKHVADGYTDWG